MKKKIKTTSNSNLSLIDKKLLKLAKKALSKNEVPISALITDHNNKIVSSGYNLNYNKKSPILHAEIIAITKLSKKNKNSNLSNYTIHITSEPCMMCLGAIDQANIKKVNYYIYSKEGFIVTNHTIEFNKLWEIKKITNEYSPSFKKLIQTFFINLRTEQKKKKLN